MDLRPEITIEVKEFAPTMDGVVVMSMPDFRRNHEMQNAWAKCFVKLKARDLKNGNGIDNIDIKDIFIGDFEMISVLAFVKKAPFERSIEEFLKYTDRMDEISFGSAEKLYAKMKETAAKIKRGELSPLEDCHQQETPNSALDSSEKPSSTTS